MPPSMPQTRRWSNRNWLGLMKGDLTEEVEKGGTRFTRRLNPDLAFTRPDGSAGQLKGRALMLCAMSAT